MTNDKLQTFAAQYLRLKQLLADIGDAQFQPGKSPVPREDTTERSKGMTSDPTLNTVADTRRLQLRAMVVQAESALEQAEHLMRDAEDDLADAHEKWLGNHSA